MPRVRRRSRERFGLTQEHVDTLLDGLDLFDPFKGDDDAKRQAWESLRADLLEDWIREHPGTRPWAFWKFEAPELRRRINGLHPFDNLARTVFCERVGYRPEIYLQTHFGTPSSLFFQDGCDDFEAVYESERAYLDRLGLLIDGE